VAIPIPFVEKVLVQTRQLKAAMVGAVAALALLVPGSSAVAVPAASPAATSALSIQLSGVALLPGQTNDAYIAFSINDPSVRQVRNLQLTLDMSALPNSVTIDSSTAGLFGWDCTTSGTTLRCSAPSSVAVGWDARGAVGDVDAYLDLNVTADAAASVTAGSLTATATATGLSTATSTASFSVAEPVKLVALPDRSLSAPPGTHDAEQWAVTNAGSSTVHGVILTLEGASLSFDQHYNDCVYDAANNAACTFNNDLAPGQTYRISAPMGFAIPATHVAPFVDEVVGGWRTPTDLDAGFNPQTGTPGTDPALSLVVQSSGAPAPALTQAGRPQTDQDSLEWTGVGITVTGTNPANLVPVGAATRVTSAGQSVTLPLGVQDLGPATASLSRTGDPITWVTVTVPTNTTATSVPTVCAPVVSGQTVWDESGQPGYPKYFCPAYANLEVGQVFPLPFTVKALLPQASYLGTVGIDKDGNGTPDTTVPITIETAVPAQQPPPDNGQHRAPNSAGPPPAGPRH
jgi:hypothetical protein